MEPGFSSLDMETRGPGRPAGQLLSHQGSQANLAPISPGRHHTTWQQYIFFQLQEVQLVQEKNSFLYHLKLEGK